MSIEHGFVLGNIYLKQASQHALMGRDLLLSNTINYLTLFFNACVFFFFLNSTVKCFGHLHFERGVMATAFHVLPRTPTSNV